MMERKPHSTRHFVASFVWFTATAAIALLLLLTAVVVWLSELTGSFIFSALIVGGFFAIVSTMIYLLSVREAIDEIHDEIDTVYEVARTVKTGYEWVTDKVELFLKLRESLRDK